MAEVLDAVVRELANLGWHGLQAVNTRVPESPSLSPEWAPGPLLKSHERTRPPLGWPRETDSLCPRCVVETRQAILSGKRDLNDLIDGHVGEIKAKIVEEDGRIIIRKTCKQHGTFEDLLSIDPEFSRVIEGRWLEGFDQAAVLRRVTCPALLLRADEAHGGMLPRHDAEKIAAFCVKERRFE